MVKDLSGRPQDRGQLASGTAGGNTSTAQLGRVDSVPDGGSDWQKYSRNVRQPSRGQRLGIKPTTSTDEIARTTDPASDRPDQPLPATNTAIVDRPGRKEAFKQLVKFVNAGGTTTGHRGEPRGRQLGTKSKAHQVDEQVQQPPKRNKTTIASGCDVSIATRVSQGNDGGASSPNAPGPATTWWDYDCEYECNWMRTGADVDDVCSSIFPGVSGGVGSSKVEGKKRKGGAHDEDRGSGGELCRAQKFRLSQPAEEHQLATNDSEDEAVWWSGVEELMHQDHLSDLSWWCEVETAIEADDRKRQHENGTTRAEASKRPRKLG